MQKSSLLFAVRMSKTHVLKLPINSETDLETTIEPTGCGCNGLYKCDVGYCSETHLRVGFI